MYSKFYCRVFSFYQTLALLFRIKVVQQSELFQFETEFYMLSPLVIKKELEYLIKNKGIHALFKVKFFACNDLNFKG